MHNSGGMRRSQCIRNLRAVFQCITDPQAFPSDQVIERFASYILHGNVVDVFAVDLLAVDVVDGDDIRMV